MAAGRLWSPTVYQITGQINFLQIVLQTCTMIGQTPPLAWWDSMTSDHLMTFQQAQRGAFCKACFHDIMPHHQMVMMKIGFDTYDTYTSTDSLEV